MMKRFLSLCLTVALAATTLVAQQRELKPGFNLFSKDQDVQLGREAATQVRRQLPIVRNADLNGYVERIGRRLASQPQADKYPYSFEVVSDKSINAFALPGGPTFIHTGLIMAAENEAQLAGVIAHEIAHVALRHGTNQASKANLIQLPAMLAGAIVGNGSMLGQLAQLGIGLGANSVLLKFSRNAERDADLLGARMMAAAGYNPIEMAHFFEKLESQGGSRAPEFLSDHPNPGNRVKAVQEEIRYLPQRNYDADAGDLNRVKQLAAAQPSQQGGSFRSAPARPPEVRPSSGFRQYQGREFSISYPENWQTYGDKDSAMVTLAPSQGIHQGPNGQALIGYGAMVSFYFPNGSRGDLQQDTATLIRQLQQNNPGMRVDGRSRRTNVDRREALVTTLRSQSPYQGEAEVDMLVTVSTREGLFYVLFIAPASEYRQVQSVYEKMLNSVRLSI